MKKITALLIFILFSLSCSVGQFLPAEATATPSSTSTITHTPLPTATPVTPTLTFTSTPTLIGLKTATFTPSSTATSLATDTPTPQDTITPTIQMDGFLFINISQTEIYKSSVCEPLTVRISAQVLDRDTIRYVLLFARFKSLTSERVSKWTNISMQTIGAGTYFHDLSSDQMLEDAFFQTAWIEFQVVATNQSGKEIGRTDIFKERIKMLACVPTVTPTSATVRP